MYGKKFIAALLFLAVAVEVKAQDPYGEEEEVYDTADFEDIPAPSGDFSDNAADVEIPEGDFDITSATFELAETADDDAVWAWADALPENPDYYPGDFVMSGQVVFSDDADATGHAIGLIHEDWESGIMALHSDLEDDMFATVEFTAEVIPDEDGDYEEDAIEEPTEDDYIENAEGYAGLGNEWGQDIDEEGNWNLWSYNDDGPEDQWEDGIYTVWYVEHDEDGFAGFSTEIEIVTSGAKQLLASATAASMLLAMM